MKKPSAPVLQELVRNPLEIFGKSIVSYIPLKSAFKNLTFLAL